MKIVIAQSETICSAGLQFLLYDIPFIRTYNKRLSARVALKIGENFAKSLYISLSIQIFFLKKSIFDMQSPINDSI